MKNDLRAAQVAGDLDEVLRKLKSCLSQLDPASVGSELLTLYIDRWEHDAPEEELEELGNRLPWEADSSSQAANAALLLGDKMRDHGYSHQERRIELEQARKRKRGAPRDAAKTIEALQMKRAGRTYREIADALCDCWRSQRTPPLPHTADVSCVDAFRKRVKGLEAILKKYHRK